jgi:hypothetical protein
MSGDIHLLTPKDALGKNHRFFVLLGQHHQAEKQNHISPADLIRIRSVSCTSQGICFFRSHSGDGSVACCDGSTEVTSTSTFGDLFERLDLIRHRFLEKRPHLEPEAKNEALQRLTAAFLYLAHDLLRESDHGEERNHRRHGV